MPLFAHEGRWKTDQFEIYEEEGICFLQHSYRHPTACSDERESIPLWLIYYDGIDNNHLPSHIYYLPFHATISDIVCQEKIRITYHSLYSELPHAMQCMSVNGPHVARYSWHELLRFTSATHGHAKMHRVPPHYHNAQKCCFNTSYYA